ncbi:isoaspartyl peptidase/L-asparaginase family protein [Qipengyuania sphaerica]|uniref:isoaspartyl peptidase/L-asparaginase family protein n=1 Tax=Qipengyuania sphaerica TaxID=2867243 RepID=UPI001C8AB83E|nr:isoaspartyl peptidase/L-asparaginase [Qipengyuania sphaerica]MBX7542071.1 isoaspartyl peptidase/L-asparaginase [Qipengyuania sphaerica]
MRGFFAKIACGQAAILALWGSPLAAQEEGKWAIAIHGGAGTIARENLTLEQEAELRESLQAALDAGAKVLANGGEALDAVEAAILLLEDDPRFNAGRGAVFTWDETHELDASIMDGRDRNAGAVAGVTNVRNPILAARAVMTESPHVMLAGEGAEIFAAEQGLEIVPNEYFDTDFRREALERLKAEQVSALDVDIKFGTVGAVVLDRHGNLAAGTSTGGMTGKRWNRIGDSPVIGAGTYADNRSCAVSATGWGEYFIRVGVAHEICTRLRGQKELSASFREMQKMPQAVAEALFDGERALQKTADDVMAEVKQLGGDGGVILVTPDGHALFSFNTSGMYRGRASSEGMSEVAIYGDE